MSALKTIRDVVGVALLDLPTYRAAIHSASAIPKGHAGSWISLCNRIENLTINPSGPGVHCDWKWGSELHACNVWPWLGLQLMRAAFRDWPIRFADSAVSFSGPRVSFIFAHSGRDRVKQLHRTIRSIFAQTDVRIECIVVGQSPSPVEGALPNGIIFRHLDKQGIPTGWHKSWAYNVGARIATGDVLVFQDGDVCAPHQYASEVAKTILEGSYDVASLQRFLFYLDMASTRQIESNDSINISRVPQRVFQNWKGGTIAIARDAFFRLGGFDEGFVDWGGEDDEFYDRCSHARHCRYGYLPFVHLWHKSQPDRKLINNPNITKVMPHRLGIPVTDRVAELVSREFGSALRPEPLVSYKSLFVK